VHELKKKLETYLRLNLLGTGPRLIKKRIYRAAVSQRLRNTGLRHCRSFEGLESPLTYSQQPSLVLSYSQSNPPHIQIHIIIDRVSTVGIVTKIHPLSHTPPWGGA